MSRTSRVLVIVVVICAVAGLTVGIVAGTGVLSTSSGCPAEVVEVFLQPTAGTPQISEVQAVIQSQHGIKTIRFVSQANGYVEFEGLYGGTDADALSESDIPPSFRVLGSNRAVDSELQAAVHGLPGVLQVTIKHPAVRSGQQPLAHPAGAYYLDLSDLVTKVGPIGKACRVGPGPPQSVAVPTRP